MSGCNEMDEELGLGNGALRLEPLNERAEESDGDETASSSGDEASPPRAIAARSARRSVQFHRSTLRPQRSVFKLRPTITTKIGPYTDNPEVDYWMPPPVEDIGANGDIAPLAVDFRCACFKLTDISTVAFTAVVKFAIYFEWSDPRLKGMPITTNDLPGDLWGPDIALENAQNDCAVIHDSFSLLCPATGRLRRTVTFHGQVYNPMKLKDFPFDSDDLELKFISTCNWRTLDGSRHGNDPCNQIYILSPMIDMAGVDFFTLGWGGKVKEFDMLGWSEEVINPVGDPSRPIVFKFDIHLVRKAQFYILKVLFPLWLIILTSLAPFGIDPDDLQGRLEVLFTLLLSTVALLYVVQESIPKISFLTLVDKVASLTLLSLTLAILFSYVISTLPNPARLNLTLALVNQVLYWAANTALLVPPYLRHRNYITEMQACREWKEIVRDDGKGRSVTISESLHFARKSYCFEGTLMNCSDECRVMPLNDATQHLCQHSVASAQA